MSVQRYLERMDASIEDKMRVINAIPKDAEYVLDVGCANGHVTTHMANLRPQTYFHGIDVELPFVGMAQANKIQEGIGNVGFSHNWLSDLHDYRTRYDVITMLSVNHEVYSYGKGITSVVKLLCDAHELLNDGGLIIIRDALRPRRDDMSMEERMNLHDKLSSISTIEQWLTAYQAERGMTYLSAAKLNDFLLHMLYTDNWDHEMQEDYMFWSAQDYIGFAQIVLNMEPLLADCYLLDYVKERWKRDLWLNDMELSNLYSTGIVVLRK